MTTTHFIIIALVISISNILTYAVANRWGIKEGREEMIKRFTKTTARQMQRLLYGGVYSKN